MPETGVKMFNSIGKVTKMACTSKLLQPSLKYRYEVKCNLIIEKKYYTYKNNNYTLRTKNYEE